MIVFTTAVDEQESSDKEKVNYITFYSILPISNQSNLASSNN